MRAILIAVLVVGCSSEAGREGRQVSMAGGPGADSAVTPEPGFLGGECSAGPEPCEPLNDWLIARRTADFPDPGGGNVGPAVNTECKLLLEKPACTFELTGFEHDTAWGQRICFELGGKPSAAFSGAYCAL